MPTAPLIRPAAPDDFDQWKPLWDGYNAFYERVGPTAVPDEITATTWERFFDAGEPVHCLVAELDGQLVGLAHYIFHRNTIMAEPTCYLQDLFTAPERRGAGIGRALIETLYEQVRDAGVRNVYWHTHKTNETAMRLYDQVATNTGFVVYRTTLSEGD